MTQTRDEQLLDAYRQHRVEDQVGYYERRSGAYERARRLSVLITALLLVLAALFGALGAADANRRAVWAFTAAAFAALGTALTTFESAFGFERLSRQFGETGAAVALRNAQGPKDRQGRPGLRRGRRGDPPERGRQVVPAGRSRWRVDPAAQRADVRVGDRVGDGFDV